MAENSVLLTCLYCGGVHQGVCPRIKAIEYAEDGITMRRVEFHAPFPVMESLAPLADMMRVHVQSGGVGAVEIAPLFPDGNDA